MAFKKIEYGISFADIAIQTHSDKTRSLLFLREIESEIDWPPVQDLLLEHFETDKFKTGEKAYPLATLQMPPATKMVSDQI